MLYHFFVIDSITTMKKFSIDHWIFPFRINMKILKREKQKLNEGNRSWTTVLQDSLIRVLKLNGENGLEKIKSAITEQLFTITKFVLQDR